MASQNHSAFSVNLVGASRVDVQTSALSCYIASEGARAKPHGGFERALWPSLIMGGFSRPINTGAPAQSVNEGVLRDRGRYANEIKNLSRTGAALDRCAVAGVLVEIALS